MATVLIVDDLAPNRAFLVTLLGYGGHRLLQAGNGREALDLVAREVPDLIITDVLMPVMDGYELVRQLRDDVRTAKVPVIFYTAHYGEREARELALASGVASVLAKPSEPEEVLAVVARVLRGAGEAPAASLGSADVDRQHLRLLTDKLSDTTEVLRGANARLRALVNIGLELASERDTHRLLLNVAVAARDVFGAHYVTLGILQRDVRIVEQFIVEGTDGAACFQPGDAIDGILDAVVATQVVHRGDNPGGNPIDLGLPATHPKVHAYLVAPISSPSYPYGWMLLARNEEHPFTDDDEHLTLALAGLVGRIYENGHFFNVAQRRAQELELEVLERRKVEAALREERDRSQRYLDTAEVIILALDIEGRIKLVNRYASTILGWSVEELVGKDWIDTCLPERIRGSLRQRFDALMHGDGSVVESPILTRTGEERLIEWRNTVLRNAQGEATGTLSSGTDITERHRAAEALKTAEERMRFALTSAEVGIWDMDYVTGTLRWSDILESQYGFEPGEFPGTFEAFIERIHPDDRDSVVQTIANATKSGADFQLQHRTFTPTGQERWLRGAGRIHCAADGTPIRGVGISLDVTARHKLEMQYQQAQKMEAVGRLAGGVAHDFNNLLTAILGYCELLQGEMGANDPRRGDLEEIQKAGMSAASLTSQLLAFSRKQIVEPTVLDLNTVLTEMRSLLDRLIGDDVKVVLVLQRDAGRVRADRGQIEQIVLNLAVNARDAMPRGGTLTIETTNVELDEHYEKTHINVKPGPFVGLVVTDTGTGMPPEVQALLFEPFFTTKEPGKGTGLGLATVHGIVSAAGGTVQVYSELGRGTSFKVYLPRTDATADIAASVVDASHDATGKTVLVVDDAEGLRELARRLLKRAGFTVLVAADANEARRLFTEYAVDVILTDVVMPGASGPELTASLLAERPGVKVVYMSGYTEETIVQHGVINPGITFLHKPFTSQSLLRKLHEVLPR